MIFCLSLDEHNQLSHLHKVFKASPALDSPIRIRPIRTLSPWRHQWLRRPQPNFWVAAGGKKFRLIEYSRAALDPFVTTGLEPMDCYGPAGADGRKP